MIMALDMVLRLTLCKDLRTIFELCVCPNLQYEVRLCYHSLQYLVYLSFPAILCVCLSFPAILCVCLSFPEYCVCLCYHSLQYWVCLSFPAMLCVYAIALCNTVCVCLKFHAIVASPFTTGITSVLQPPRSCSHEPTCQCIPQRRSSQNTILCPQKGLTVLFPHPYIPTLGKSLVVLQNRAQLLPFLIVGYIA